MRASGKPVRLYPPKVSKGDTVGIISPGSPIARDLLRAGCNKLESLYAIHCLAGDRDIGVSFQQARYVLSREIFVVNNDNSDHC